ncbi:MAG: hypothetical protein ACRC2R_13405 [Xenococcaceae cyanobacterium]
MYKARLRSTTVHEIATLFALCAETAIFLFPILWRCHGKQWQVIEKIEKSELTYSGLFCR